MWTRSPNFKSLLVSFMTDQPINTLRSDGFIFTSSAEQGTQLILKYEAMVHKINHGSEALVTPENSYFLDKIVILDPYSGAKKYVSDASLLFIKQFIRENSSIKTALLDSKSPNYFEETIANFGSSNSISWLKSIARKNLSVLSHLSPSLIFDMLSHEISTNPDLIHFFLSVEGPIVNSNPKYEFALSIVKWLVEITIEGTGDRAFAVIFDGASQLIQDENFIRSSVFAQQALICYLRFAINYRWFDVSKHLNDDTIKWLDQCRTCLDCSFNLGIW